MKPLCASLIFLLPRLTLYFFHLRVGLALLRQDQLALACVCVRIDLHFLHSLLLLHTSCVAVYASLWCRLFEFEWVIIDCLINIARVKLKFLYSKACNLYTKNLVRAVLHALVRNIFYASVFKGV